MPWLKYMTAPDDGSNITVRSGKFAGHTLIEQHQFVYGALKGALKDGRLRG